MDRSNSETDSQQESRQELLDLVRFYELGPVELKQCFDKNLGKYDTDGDGRYSSREVSLALLDDDLNKENSKFFLLMREEFSTICSLAGEDFEDYVDKNCDGQVTLSELDQATQNPELTSAATGWLSRYKSEIKDPNGQPWYGGQHSAFNRRTISRDDLNALDNTISIIAKDDKGSNDLKPMPSVANVTRESRSLTTYQNRINHGLYATPDNPIASINGRSVQQHGIGNCGFQSSLSAYAEVNPQAIKDMIRVNSDGSYSVSFPNEKTIQVAKPSRGEQLAFSGISPGGMWVGILERALGVLRSDGGWTADPAFPLRGSTFPQECTEAIDADRSLNLLTGKKIRYLDLTSLANLHKHLTAAHDHRLPAVAKLLESGPYMHLPPRESVSGLVAHHFYAILDYDSKNKLVTVRDPNGYYEPENEDQTALDGQRDGVFTMPLSRFAKVFCQVTVTR